MWWSLLVAWGVVGLFAMGVGVVLPACAGCVGVVFPVAGVGFVQVAGLVVVVL
ncbi:hypothetical protein GCM10025785_18370 [Corynebacterium canis]